MESVEFSSTQLTQTTGRPSNTQVTFSRPNPSPAKMLDLINGIYYQRFGYGKIINPHSAPNISRAGNFV